MAGHQRWLEVYMSMRGILARAVSRIVPPDDVEDIVQETYVRLARIAPSGHVRHSRSYLLQTARNLALDHIKRHEFRFGTSWDESSEADSGLHPSKADPVYDETVSQEEFGRFCEAVRMLPLQCRRVFVLKKVYGYSQRDIARELGLAESTVEKHVAKALALCARALRHDAQPAPVRREEISK